MRVWRTRLASKWGWAEATVGLILNQTTCMEQLAVALQGRDVHVCARATISPVTVRIHYSLESLTSLPLYIPLFLTSPSFYPICRQFVSFSDSLFCTVCVCHSMQTISFRISAFKILPERLKIPPPLFDFMFIYCIGHHWSPQLCVCGKQSWTCIFWFADRQPQPTHRAAWMTAACARRSVILRSWQRIGRTDTNWWYYLFLSLCVLCFSFFSFCDSL